MRRLATVLVSLTFLVLSLGVAANAQGHFRRDRDDSARRGKFMKNLENLRLLKLLEVLNLNENQNDQFISAFSKFRNASKSIQEKIETDVTDLSDYLKDENKSDDVILKKVDEIVKMKEEIEKERKDFFENTKNILTAEQLGKMMVFQERFEREMLEKVRGFRAPEPPSNPDQMPDVPMHD